MSTINSIPVVDLQQADSRFPVTVEPSSNGHHHHADADACVLLARTGYACDGPLGIPFPKTFTMSRRHAEIVAAFSNREVLKRNAGKLILSWHIVCRAKLKGFVCVKVDIPPRLFQPRDEYDFPDVMVTASGLTRTEAKHIVRRINSEPTDPELPKRKWALIAKPIRRPEPLDIAEVEEPEADATLSSIREALGEFATVTQLSTGELSVQFTLPERYTRFPKREGRQMISDVMDVFCRAGFIASQAVRRLDALGTFGRVRPMESEMVVHPVSHMEKRFACFEFEDIDIVVRNCNDHIDAAAAVREFLRAATVQAAGVADCFEDDDEPEPEAETLTLNVVGGSRNGETLTVAVPAGVEEMTIDGERFVVRRHFGDLLHSPLPVETEVSA